MVTDQAWRMSSHLSSVQAFRVGLAALLHDTGKGLTDPRYWPSHHGHEKAGIAPALSACLRLGVDEETTAFACLATGTHGLVHTCANLTPQRLVQLLVDDVGGVEHPHRFEMLMLVCEADARGRTGFEDRDYDQPAYLRAVMTAIRQVGLDPNPQNLLKDRVWAVKKVRREIREETVINVNERSPSILPW
jgi:tRNA nucleotidyltransferase (CCA-adding enzyme)